MGAFGIYFKKFNFGGEGWQIGLKVPKSIHKIRTYTNKYLVIVHILIVFKYYYAKEIMI